MIIRCLFCIYRKNLGISLIIRIPNINTEINMEKNSPSICMITVIAIATALVIPMPGIIAENDNSISKELQLCCSYIEDEKANSHTLSTPIIEINSNFHL